MKKYGLLSVLLLCLTACSVPRQTEKAASRNAIVWTNQLVEPLLVFDNSVISYRLKPKYRRRAVPFSAAEKALPLKGDTYNYDLNSLDGRYYTVAKTGMATTTNSLSITQVAKMIRKYWLRS